MSESTENNIFKIALNLILTCLVSGLIIGCVYYITGPIAKVKAEQMKQDSTKLRAWAIMLQNPNSAASSRVRNWTTWKLLKTRARRTSSKL